MITTAGLYPPGVTSRDIDRHYGGPDPELCIYCEEPVAEDPEFAGVCPACAARLCVHCGAALAASAPEYPDQDPVCGRCARRAYPSLRRSGFAAVTAWAFACGRSEPPIRMQPWWAARGQGAAQ